MPRKTESNKLADWLYFAREDVAGISELAQREISYELCRSKLAEVIETVSANAYDNRRGSRLETDGGGEEIGDFRFRVSGGESRKLKSSNRAI